MLLSLRASIHRSSLASLHFASDQSVSKCNSEFCGAAFPRAPMVPASRTCVRTTGAIRVSFLTRISDRFPSDLDDREFKRTRAQVTWHSRTLLIVHSSLDTRLRHILNNQIGILNKGTSLDARRGHDCAPSTPSRVASRPTTAFSRPRRCVRGDIPRALSDRHIWFRAWMRRPETHT